MDQQSANEGSGNWKSTLGAGRDRFLAHAIEHALGCGRRRPEDFIRHFPPMRIMDALRDEPQRRANILVIATGVRTSIAAKKSPESSGEDLQIALDEEEADAETIVSLFDPDDRVRYLPAPELWNFLSEGAFWKLDSTAGNAYAQAKAHVAFLLDRALDDGILAHADVVDAIGIERLTESLPRSELARIIEAALEVGKGEQPFGEMDLLSAAPPTTLVEHLPLEEIWTRIVVPRIAMAHGLLEPQEQGMAEGVPGADEVTDATANPDTTPPPAPETEAGGATAPEEGAAPVPPASGAAKDAVRGPAKAEPEVDVEVDVADDGTSEDNPQKPGAHRRAPPPPPKTASR